LAKIIIEQVLDNINKIFGSYDKLHEFETVGCTTEQMKKELVTLKEATEKLSTAMIRLFKENPTQIKGLSTLSGIFKITYLPTLKIHLLYLSQIQESNNRLLKIQSRLAITYLNVDGCIDNLRIIYAYLK
jgi:hypothetical protein